MNAVTRWYVVDKDGIATLCNSQADAEASAVEYESMFPARRPYIVTPMRVGGGQRAADSEAVDGYYLASFRASGSTSAGVLWWMPDNRGYTTDLNQAGVYTEIKSGYHDSEHTVPVPVAMIEKLRVRCVVDPGDSLNQMFWSAESLRAALAKQADSGEGQS